MEIIKGSLQASSLNSIKREQITQYILNHRFFNGEFRNETQLHKKQL